jgi:hypothetical protein
MKGLCRLFYSAACFEVNEGYAKLIPANGLVFHKTGCAWGGAVFQKPITSPQNFDGDSMMAMW